MKNYYESWGLPVLSTILIGGHMAMTDFNSPDYGKEPWRLPMLGAIFVGGAKTLGLKEMSLLTGLLVATGVVVTTPIRCLKQLTI